MQDGWHRVSRGEPCPICEHADWCMLSNDGNVCICQRVESDKPTKNSGGWVHRLRDAAQVEGGRREVEQRNLKSSSVQPPTFNLQPSIAAYFAALPTTWHNAQERLCARLEKDLGLPKDILIALDWRWDATAHAVAIPMRTAWGEVTGIRYRSLENGSKWAKRGSKDGLFFDPGFIPYDPEELIICEGPTDCAAAMACGFWAVGRSSCGTGRDLIRDLMKIHRVKRITIIADDDKPKPKPGGGTWQPGIDGANRLAQALRCPYRIILPPPGIKDLRDWYKAGTLTPLTLSQAIATKDWSIHEY